MGTEQWLEQQYRLLGELYVHLKNAETAYKLYLQNNKQFLFARILRNSNDSILQLLTKNAYLLSPELLNDSLQMMTHLHIWKEKWEALEKKLQPELDAEFVFENNFTFPREAAQNLENAFLALRSKIMK